MAYNLRMVLHFSMVGKKSKEEYHFLTCATYMKFRSRCSKVLLEHSPAVCCLLAAFKLSGQI